ncbi:MAG: hypothetical protein BRD44_03920 [Bacteroidetes bacterium QS_7_67_15]|nr:MAG: hypothetical protein BRD44_03920 [Bacteroidetes bacterium QS_7_67_15]
MRRAHTDEGQTLIRRSSEGRGRAILEAVGRRLVPNSAGAFRFIASWQTRSSPARRNERAENGPFPPPPRVAAPMSDAPSSSTDAASADAASGDAPPASSRPHEGISGNGQTASADGEAPLPPPGSPTSWTRMLWPLTLSLLALGAVAAFTFKPGAFWKVARTVNPWLLAGACAITALRVFVGGWRFRFISDGRLGLAEGVRGQLAWDFLSNFTPTAIGGGPIAIVYLARDQNIPVGEASAFMLFSMVLDQIWFALSIPLLLGASSFFNVFPDVAYGFGHWTFFAVFAGMLVWAILFSYAILFQPQLLRRLAGWVFSLRPLRRFRRRVVREATRFSERAHRMREQSVPFYLKSFLLTIGVWMGRYLLAVIVVWSVHPALDVVPSARSCPRR